MCDQNSTYGLHSLPGGGSDWLHGLPAAAGYIDCWLQLVLQLVTGLLGNMGCWLHDCLVTWAVGYMDCW
jgi:hypothetical protein